MRTEMIGMALACAVAACGGSAPYVWVNDLPVEPPAAHEYRIGVGDTISLQGDIFHASEDTIFIETS